MEIFEPLVNLLVLLTVLSFASERITNLMKLRSEDLRMVKKSEAKDEEDLEAKEKVREYKITQRSFLTGIILALLVKANLFEILVQLENPWRALGWIQVHDSHWVRTAATASWGTFLYALAGCFLTGVALGFGNKFWHDILGTAFEIRDLTRNYKKRVLPAAPAAAGEGKGAGHAN